MRGASWVENGRTRRRFIPKRSRTDRELGSQRHVIDTISLVLGLRAGAVPGAADTRVFDT